MRGGDTAGLRAYNERLIVSALLRSGALSKAEIARETGLSGQAASVIVNALIADGMLLKQPKVRGQVGQPSTPIAPNPEGAYALGVKIGRRSVEAVLLDMLGGKVASEAESYPAPLPDRCLPRARRARGALPRPAERGGARARRGHGSRDARRHARLVGGAGPARGRARRMARRRRGGRLREATGWSPGSTTTPPRPAPRR